MDAARLVAEGERVMRGRPQPEQVIAEAWQAYELTEAVGRFLGTSGGADPPRAARLSGVRDPTGTLRALRLLLGEIGRALVDLTGSADDVAAYGQCIEALDAVDEAKDRVRALIRAACA